MITVLFAEKNGVYSKMPGIDLWDIKRDARNYFGNNPVIAHPPCNRWCKMSKMIQSVYNNNPEMMIGNDQGCFFHALFSVRRCGGVLEHPALSLAWPFFGLSKPPKRRWIRCIDRIGWVCEVWQSAYGHKANKATWLYYVGKKKPYSLIWDMPKGDYQISYGDHYGEFRKPVIPKKEASATPAKFRDELIKLANHSR